MKIATWNVNSLRVRLPQLLDWLAACPVDVIGIQETKLVDEAFPHAELAAAGYHAVHNGQKTYNGVALLSRLPITDVVRDLPGFADEQRRVIAGTVDGVRVINVYVVNGQAVGSDKYHYKLRFLEALRRYVAEELSRYPELAVVGDFNIAPAPEDTHDPAAWEGQILCSEAERDGLRALLALGLKDGFRLFEQPPQSFSWWDYRQAAFRRNMGLRIDHVLLSPPLAARCVQCWIDTAPRRLERPSDHAPVVAELVASSAK
ncbi:exodeoxyribonuclease III [Sinimarinibacterium thermocellulolyticum]|uniref:Exodeoxyribonuclease III n=1 Tax=Sinimarinibacterium thermocellulolyticum TaxID=3170016 RepID=A0ABV2A8M4_9GAMM